MKKFVRKIYWILSQQVGIDIRKLINFAPGFVRYCRDVFRLNQKYGGMRLSFVPCVHDFYDSAGQADTEYFWQDLLVARLIFEAAPQRHIDIGSRIDGFVAHVASFRTIEVCDVRTVESSIPWVCFRHLDLMNLPSPDMKSDSVSCLHALEHFGLGRYGDPLNLEGDRIGFRNISSLVKAGGTLYLSVPIGKPRIEFNANRVYHPSTIVEMSKENGLMLLAFYSYKDKQLNFSEVEVTDSIWDDLANRYYGLGVFVFKKLAE